MGIYDREWYRGASRGSFRGSPRRASVVTWLIGANVVCYLLFAAFAESSWARTLRRELWLQPEEALGGLKVWQFLTSVFLHANLVHLLFNMLVLYMFGGAVESRLGRGPFLRFYLLAGLSASLAFAVLGILTRSPAGAVGASGAIMGLIIYFAMLRPDAVVYLFFFIPMRMKVAALVIVGADLFLFVFSQPGSTGIAHTAHLGGALYGFLYFRYAGRVSGFLSRRRSRAASKSEDRARRRTAGMAAEVDRLLAKISESGIGSLTDKEKRYLQEASDELRRRSGGPTSSGG